MLCLNKFANALFVLLLVGCGTQVASSPVSRGDNATDYHGEKVALSDEQWRKRLTPQQFDVTRRHGTELPYSGSLLKQKAAGKFTCACCGAPLFDSSSKFDSHTGWPSFWQPIKDSPVGTSVDRDLGSVRTEVHCNRCDAHLGQVFDDGPQPTGLRYCINSVALGFQKAAGSKTSER